MDKVTKAEMTLEERLSSLERILENHAHPTDVGLAGGDVPDQADIRLAAQMASEIVKGLLQIGVATFVGAAGFLQFLVSRQVPLESAPVGMVGSGLLAILLSLSAGFLAMSGLYKEGKKRRRTNEPWASPAIEGHIDLQAWSGVLALLLLVGAVVASAGFFGG